jgi:5'-nucleotidase
MITSICLADFDLTLLHMNDIHSHLEAPSDKIIVEGTTYRVDMGGYGLIAARVNEVKQAHENTLFLIAGDAVKGTLYHTVYQGQADFNLLNQVGVDAMCLGNHEFDDGPDTLATYYDMAEFPILAANVDAGSDPNLAGKIQAYCIKEIKGEKIGIIGVVTETTAFISSPGDNVIFTDVIAAVSDAVAALEAQGVNKIIVLSHLGHGDNSGDLELAAAVSGVDIIVGGHSHTLLGDFSSVGKTSSGAYPTTVVNPAGEAVYVVQAWENAKLLGTLSVVFDDSGKVTSVANNTKIAISDQIAYNDYTPLDATQIAELEVTLATMNLPVSILVADSM